VLLVNLFCSLPQNNRFLTIQNKDKPLTVDSVRKVLGEICKKSGISKKVSAHTFRHCFATHLLESGTNVFVIKVLLGHTSISSTCRYLQLVRMDAFEIKNPLDVLEDYDNA
jgi:integrase/recombinase XerD